MACLLSIETSTTVCSLTLSVNGKSVFDRLDVTPASHAAVLGVFAKEAVEQARQQNWKIEAVAVSAGPGSYTGLRIGVSEAKGLCYGLDIPLIALPTLKIIASQVLPLSPALPYPAPLICPMLDARRMEVYAALYDENLNEVRPAQADIIDANSYMEYLENHPLIFLGNGAEKCRDVLLSANAHFVPDVFPTAQAMISLAELAFEQQDFVDTAYFEPFYLKEFQATVAKNKVLG